MPSWKLNWLLLLAVAVQGFYIPQSDKDGGKRDDSGGNQAANQLLASGSVTKEWLDCKGMPCEEWYRTQEKISQILQIQYRKATKKQAPQSQTLEQHIEPIDGTLDGCVWLTESQSDVILGDLREELGETHPDRNRKKRKMNNMFLNTYNKWPTDRPIIYKFDGGHSVSDEQIIRDAFHHWERHTCMRFQEVPLRQQVNDHHIIITAAMTGCHSSLGRASFWPQPLNLMYTCLWSFGTPIHEIAHALGMWHEQQRVDRDQYVQVNQYNLGSRAGQYTIQRHSIDYGVEYDYSSVMHYSPYEGSWNGQPAMEAVDANYQQNMGQRVEASWNDIKMINRAYCNQSCVYRLPHACENDGYQDPNSCGQCKCPAGFSGTYCQQLAPAVGDACGGELKAAAGAYKELVSPNYYTTKRYRIDQECSWRITAPEGHRVVLNFTDEFGLYCHQQKECYHWVEVRTTANLGRSGPRFCCRDAPDVRMVSETHQMMVVFKSAYPTSSALGRRGFKAIYLAEPISGNGYSSSTTVHTTTPTTTSTTPTTTTTTTARPNTARTSTSTTTAPSSPVWGRQVADWLWWCGFEDGVSSWCSVEQEQERDEFDWSLGRQGTDSRDTGPTGAHTGQFYAYIEASNPIQPNDEATLYLPSFEREGPHCLSFAYNMNGYHIRELKVFLENSGEKLRLWSHQGHVGPAWSTASITINLILNTRVGFTGVRGDEYSGDIAIDDISLVPGDC